MKTTGILFVAALTLGLGSPSAEQPKPRRKAKVRKPVKKVRKAKLNLSKITFVSPKSKTAKVAKPRALKIKATPAPPPLPDDQLIKAIARIRDHAGTAGYKLKPKLIEIAQPPSEIVLTPDKPIVGKSWLGVYVGISAPGGLSESDPAPVMSLYQYGYVRVHVEPLVLNATYMLDCTVTDAPHRVWQVSGLASANVNPQAGHILIGFIATKTNGDLTLLPDKTIHAKLYGCQLTRLG